MRYGLFYIMFLDVVKRTDYCIYLLSVAHARWVDKCY